MTATRAVLRGVGELFITAGLVLLLFCVYQLVWTNVKADRATQAVSKRLISTWAEPQPSATTGLAPIDYVLGKPFALLRIPRLGAKFKVPIVQGVGLTQLAEGVGHYPNSAGPGEVGNFAVAGHRATNGEPFRNLDRMRKGDKVVVEVKDTWLTYVVDSTRIVKPTDVWVIDPVPGKEGATPTQKLLTLTTCNPRWASTERLIVFTHLVQEQPKVDGLPEALKALSAGGSR